MAQKIGGRNRSENVGRSREKKMLEVETCDIMAFSLACAGQWMGGGGGGI